MSKALILASASPRRAQILAQVGLKFKIIMKPTDENIKADSPEKWCVLWLKKMQQCCRGGFRK